MSDGADSFEDRKNLSDVDEEEEDYDNISNGRLDRENEVGVDFHVRPSPPKASKFK